MDQNDLIEHLSHELWQTETSASQHCRREAERLGDTPPAHPLLMAAEHADDVLRQLPRFEGLLARPPIGMAVGKLFSVIRDSIGDRVLRRERSYRATLIGLRHGVDLVQLLHEAASHTGHAELTHFFESWLRKRTPLVEAAARELRWFAERPNVALEVAKGVAASMGKHDAERAAE